MRSIKSFCRDIIYKIINIRILSIGCGREEKSVKIEVERKDKELPDRFSGETFTVNNASSKTITLPNNSVYLLVASSNIGEMAKLIFARFDTISNITNLRSPASDGNWNVTSSGLNLTIQNTASQYAMIATLYRLH